MDKEIIKDLLCARTIFAFMFYVTLCYLVVRQFPVPDILKEIVSFVLGFYFGNKSSKGETNGSVDKKPIQ